MDKKVLFIASIGQHLLRFHLPTIDWLKSEGHQVHAGCMHGSELALQIPVHEISFDRQPFSFRNVKAYFQLRKLLQTERFDIIHCHTAVASVITRLVARPFRRKGNIKVIYTAHGFHFFKGGPWYYWILYYPVERFCSRFMDCQITINSEDYDLATKKFHCKDVRKISGMGVDSKRFMPLSNEIKEQLMMEFSIPQGSKILVYVAEFIVRKNHDFILKIAHKLKESIPNLVIILPGRGKLLEDIKGKAMQGGFGDFLIFPGFRKDIEKIIGFSHVGISSSRQEGLGMNLIEALMCGIPVVATLNRGHKEIISHGKNGFLFRSNNQEEFLGAIEELLLNEAKYAQIALEARKSVARFDLELSLREIVKIYNDYL